MYFKYGPGAYIFDLENSLRSENNVQWYGREPQIEAKSPKSIPLDPIEEIAVTLPKNASDVFWENYSVRESEVSIYIYYGSYS